MIIAFSYEGARFHGMNIRTKKKQTNIAGSRTIQQEAGPRSAVGSASDSRARGPGFDIRSGHILSFLLPLIQDGQLSVTGKSMCTKYWLTAKEV